MAVAKGMRGNDQKMNFCRADETILGGRHAFLRMFSSFGFLSQTEGIKYSMLVTAPLGTSTRHPLAAARDCVAQALHGSYHDTIFCIAISDCQMT